MRFTRMNRFTAALVHLSLSALVAAAAFTIIYFLWFPGALFGAAGGLKLFALIVGVDVALGPLLTLVVFVPGKKGLKFDLTVIALRASTYQGAPVARRALALQDRTIGLLAEILQTGRARDLARDVDVLSAARALVHVASGARLAWANGLTSESGCQKGIDSAVDLLFRGIGRSPDA